MNELIKLIEEAEKNDLYISVVVHNDKNIDRAGTKIFMPINKDNANHTAESLLRIINNF